MHRPLLVFFSLASVLCSLSWADDVLPELPAAAIGKKYTCQISMVVTGTMPFTYALGGEEKPQGLLINPLSGILQGVPTRAAVGTHRLRVVVTDYAGKQAIQDYVLHVTNGPAPLRPPTSPAANSALTSPAAKRVVGGIEPGDETHGSVGGALPASTPAREAAPPSPHPDPEVLKIAGDPAPAPLKKIASPSGATASAAGVTNNATQVQGGNGGAAGTQSGSGATQQSQPADTAASKTPFIASATAGVKTLAVTSPKFTSYKDVASANYAIYTVDQGNTCVADSGKQLAIIAGTSSEAKQGETTTLTLTQSLAAKSQVCAVETFWDKSSKSVGTANSNVVTATSLEADWGRVRAYFVGGLLITNDSSSFSSAHQFYALNIEKTWRLPGCYFHTPVDVPGTAGCIKEGSVGIIDLSGVTVTFKKPVVISQKNWTAASSVLQDATVSVTDDEELNAGGNTLKLSKGQTFTVSNGNLNQATVTMINGSAHVQSGQLTIVAGQVSTATALHGVQNLRPWSLRHFRTPGISTYFETRLTSIPVASNAANTTTCPSTNSSESVSSTTTTCPTTSNGQAASGTTSNASSPSSSFLTSQQTATVGVGMYLPFLLTGWTFDNTPNALFIAPIAKIGFSTLTSATSQTVVLPSNGGTGSQNFEQLYNFYDYGFRVGHMGLTETRNSAPETYSYLDISFGRFSNLESLICHRKDQGGSLVFTGTACGNYPASLGYAYESRKRLYRIDLEGLLKIPTIPVYVGLNANIGQKEVQAEKLDEAFKAPDDLRFLFGTKLDIASIFTKLGVKQQ